MVMAMCGVQLKNGEKAEGLLLMLGLNKAMDLLARQAYGMVMC